MNNSGREAEDRALRWLQRQGLTLVERNWRCQGGELDLVMRDAGVWVFVEVRHRASERFGGAAESLTPAKQRRLRLAAATYLHVKGLDDARCRFDAVLSRGDGRLDWMKNFLA
ncbi:MAG: YraN family protein [Paludibacterium sp.]|uniref:YraN family protein n=1 Tax=Paludibacterium sp. TaxID=1917523 RepID=UPI0025E652F1|nr:YraN family protein [Paludibacterium sp.]MBV8046723.1 YraN family protein [Paludibacterium sp.]MBV8645774.1 YraN family protein [Paludibacterium sp.]